MVDADVSDVSHLVSNHAAAQTRNRPIVLPQGARGGLTIGRLRGLVAIHWHRRGEWNDLARDRNPVPQAATVARCDGTLPRNVARSAARSASARSLISR